MPAVADNDAVARFGMATGKRPQWLMSAMVLAAVALRHSVREVA